MPTKLSLKGHCAVVTGGARGIGKDIAKLFLEQGCNVMVLDVLPNELQVFTTEYNPFIEAGAFLALKCDVSSLESLQEAFKGGIDIVVNNAGILHSTSLENITEAEWDKIMAINLKGPFFTTQCALSYMKQKQWGRIINIASISGRMGGFESGIGYSASKGGVIALSKGFATRLAPWGITSNSIAPGTIESDIIKQYTSEAIEGLRKRIPLGKLGETIDIANLALFLASDMSSFITGATIDINGGMYIG